MPPSPTTATNDASPLSVALSCVRDLLVEAGVLPPDSILVGKLELTAVSAPPRILFIPEVKGTWGDPPTGTGGTGYVAGVSHGCDVYIWGEPDPDPFLEWCAADLLADAVINAIRRASRAFTSGGPYEDPSPQAVSKYGETIRMRFVYSRGVKRNQRIWSLPSRPIAPSPPDINKPDGSPASTVAPLSINVALTET